MKKPFFQWTVAAATSISDAISAAASGVMKPIASSSPPTISTSPGIKRVTTTGTKAESFEELAGAVEAVAAEPSENLLGAMGR